MRPRPSARRLHRWRATSSHVDPSDRRAPGDRTMSATAEVDVTLSADLFDHLKAEAERLGVPLAWLVASLVVDTFDDEPAVVEAV